MKHKQQTVNKAMFLLLFFLLVWQSFHITTLYIGTYSEHIFDLRFFLVLIASSYLLLTVSYGIVAFSVLHWNVRVSFNIPKQLQYYTVIYRELKPNKTHKTYQLLNVRRC